MVGITYLRQDDTMKNALKIALHSLFWEFIVQQQLHLSAYLKKQNKTKNNNDNNIYL